MKLKLGTASFGKVIVAATAFLATHTAAWAASQCLFKFKHTAHGDPAVVPGSMLGACPSNSPRSSLACDCGFDVSVAGSRPGVFAYTNCIGSSGGDTTHHLFNDGDYAIQSGGMSSGAACELVDR